MHYFKNRIYRDPALLFLFLAIIFVFAGSYLDRKDSKIREQKVISVTDQTRSYLETFSVERKQAVVNLMQSWPSNEPNIEDWFNVQAQLLSSTQKGYSSLVHANEDKRITWVFNPELQAAGSRIRPDAIGKHIRETGLDVPPKSEDFSHRILSELYAGEINHYLIVGRIISPQEPAHGYLIVSYNLNNIISALLGELTEESDDGSMQFSLQLRDQETLLLNSGEFSDTETSTTTEEFEFIFRDWVLTVQAKDNWLSTGWVVAGVGILMSFMLGVFLHYQFKNSEKLNLSQRRFKTASEVKWSSHFGHGFIVFPILIFRFIWRQSAVV